MFQTGPLSELNHGELECKHGVLFMLVSSAFYTMTDVVEYLYKCHIFLDVDSVQIDLGH